MMRGTKGETVAGINDGRVKRMRAAVFFWRLYPGASVLSEKGVGDVAGSAERISVRRAASEDNVGSPRDDSFSKNTFLHSVSPYDGQLRTPRVMETSPMLCVR